MRRLLVEYHQQKVADVAASADAQAVSRQALSRLRDHDALEVAWSGTLGRQGMSLTRGGGSSLGPSQLVGH